MPPISGEDRKACLVDLKQANDGFEPFFPSSAPDNPRPKRIHKIRIRMCSGRLGLVSTSRRQIRFVKTRHPSSLGSPREISDQR
jgi:hypothetical protein